MNAHTTIAAQPTELRLTPPIALLRALPPGPLASALLERTRQIAELFAAFDRNDMEIAVDLLLAEQDARDGDPDLELNGDELDGTAAEDDFWQHNREVGMAGCPVSDPGEEVDEPEEDDSGSDVAWLERVDQSRAALPRVRQEQRIWHSDGQCIGTPEDLEADDDDKCPAGDDDLSDFGRYGSPDGVGRVLDLPGRFMDQRAGDTDDQEPSGWSEWHTRGRRKLTSEGTEEGGTYSVLSSPRHEDEEEDDPREANGDEQDHGHAEDDFGASHAANGPGCPISDPDRDDHAEHDMRTIADPGAYEEQVGRIRRTRCYQHFYRYRDWGTGQVVREPRGWRLYRAPPTPTRRSLLRRKRGLPRSPRP